MDIKQLSAEFPREKIHWRVQGQPYERNGKHSAMALCYIDARDVMDKFDEVCGPENWQCKYAETQSGRVVCSIGVLIGDAWVWKSDGAGSTQVEGEKGGLSDALKRAAVVWGVGRYLYSLDTPWVGCEVKDNKGRKYWKRWTEDPWSKVKNAGYPGPAIPKPPEDPAPDHDATVARLKTAIKNQTDTATLEKLWGQSNFQANVNALPDDMKADVQKAYADKQADLFVPSANE